ncbi:MAG: type II toxin-antitoxin system Phd/YefM family antitoxin [Gammaproteobacteria bacterium]
MRTVNIYEAKTQLSKLLDQVAGGEAIVIARAGRPLAKLVPYRQEVADRVPGCWRGRVTIAPDF